METNVSGALGEGAARSRIKARIRKGELDNGQG